MLPFAYLSKRILPCKMWGIGMCFSSAATPAPGRIYTQRELFEVKKAMMTSNNPESYALASAFMNHRADRPSNYKPDVPMGRFIQPSLKEKRLLVLTRIYKRVSDIPESISEVSIAMMMERLNFVASMLLIFSVFCSFLITINMMYDVMLMVESD